MTSTVNSQTSIDVITKMAELYCELMEHDGYGDFRVEMRILRRQQKEIIIHCGKQHRFVVDYNAEKDLASEAMTMVESLALEAGRMRKAS